MEEIEIKKTETETETKELESTKSEECIELKNIKK